MQMKMLGIAQLFHRVQNLNFAGAKKQNMSAILRAYALGAVPTLATQLSADAVKCASRAQMVGLQNALQ